MVETMAIWIDRQLRPDERLQALLSFSGNVEIDPNVSGKFYYKSGLNMYKQFHIYYSEGSWENAFCIYLKYDKLFFDRIKQHPEYRTVPVQVKSVNAAHFRMIKPKAEHAKREIFKQYRRDYVSYVEEMRANKRQQIRAEKVDRETAPGRSITHQNPLGTLCVPYRVIPIDTVPPAPVSIKAEASPDTPLDRNLFTNSTTFEIRSQVSFNTSRKVAQFAWRKKKILTEEAEASATKTFSVQPTDQLGAPGNAVDLPGNGEGQMGAKFALTSYTREAIRSSIPRNSDESLN